jgi:hypothetical protein
MTDRVSTNPLAAPADVPGDCDLGVWNEFGLFPGLGEAPADHDRRPPPSGSSVVSGDRYGARWPPSLHERLGEEPDGEDGDVADVLGQTLLALRGQALGRRPLALARALCAIGARSVLRADCVKDGHGAAGHPASVLARA